MIDYKHLNHLPKHLLDYVIDQNYDQYSYIDHAVWRYVMRQNIDFLPKVTHSSYISGLQKTGITVDSIPNMYGMNRILKDIGWAAVAVDGFIPPSAFMEFQAHKVLVIAEDIRSVEHIGYTPAPDIIHESAGHAPIIADEEYSDYLRLFGEIGSKAFSSLLDYEIYEAVRFLSIIKEDSETSIDKIKEAENKINILTKKNTILSEMTKIRNLHWWTVEYGLIGDLNNPKIYGAGLLSSIEESKYCLSNNVKKLPYSILAANKSFDITEPQPQLFVTPDFKYLNDVLMEFSKDMAFKKGGVYGLSKACDYKGISTCVLDSGLQISGNFVNFISKNNDVVFIKTEGETAISYKNKEIIGQGVNYHSHGYSCPIGLIDGFDKILSLCSDLELEERGVLMDNFCDLNFTKGISLKGKVINIIKDDLGNILIIQFSDCLVKYKDQVLFEPSWGIFDLSIGSKIVSIYPGFADQNSFKREKYEPKHKTHKKVYDSKTKKLDKMYRDIRVMRDLKTLSIKEIDNINDIFYILKNDYKNEWLLVLELLELCINFNLNKTLILDVQKYLIKLKGNIKSHEKFIDDGLKLLK